MEKVFRARSNTSGGSKIHRAAPAPTAGWLFGVALAIAACSRTGSDYFPLDAGRQWEYQLSMTVLDETERSRFRVRNVAIVHHDDRTVTVVEQPGNARGYYTQTAEGVVRIGTARGVDGRVRTDDARHFILRAPLQPGTSWTLTSRLTLIESIFYQAGERIRDREVPVTLTYTIDSLEEQVTVPAGTFSHCVKVSAAGSAVTRVNQGANFGHIDVYHTDWYAPGVGLVKSERKEVSDSPYLKPGEYRQELLQVL